jgi:hypothetical protein
VSPSQNPIQNIDCFYQNINFDRWKEIVAHRQSSGVMLPRFQLKLIEVTPWGALRLDVRRERPISQPETEMT